MCVEHGDDEEAIARTVGVIAGMGAGAVTKYADEVTELTYANKLDIDSDFKGFNLDDSEIFFKNTDDIKPLENSKPDVVDDIIDKADDVVESGTNLGKMDLDDFPQNVKDSFKKYYDAGWQGNVSGQTQGTNAGRTWGNRKGQLQQLMRMGIQLHIGNLM